MTLLKKLENTGIRGNTLQWLDSYLMGRGQKVDINGTFSDLFEILGLSLVQGSSLISILSIKQTFQCSLFERHRWHQNVKNLEKITCWYMSNKLTINFEKNNAIFFQIL